MERLQLLVHEHRRLLAAALSGLAVLAALTALRQAPDLTPVPVAARDLASGHVVTADDLGTAAVPPSAVPARALDRADAIGRRVAGPMREGEFLTDVRVVRPGSLDGFGEDAVLTTIRVDRADAASLGVGDRVDVVAVEPDGTRPATVVARAVEIVMIPESDDSSTSLGVVTTEENALALASAGLSSRFSVLASSR